MASAQLHKHAGHLKALQAVNGNIAMCHSPLCMHGANSSSITVTLVYGVMVCCAACCPAICVRLIFFPLTQSTHEDKDSVHIVMELCQGGELFDHIVEAQHLTERKV